MVVVIMEISMSMMIKMVMMMTVMMMTVMMMTEMIFMILGMIPDLHNYFQPS